MDFANNRTYFFIYKQINMELRDYQIDIANKGLKILKEKRLVYLAMEV